MDISEILKLKFPSANFMQDIKLQDNGQGPYIKEWHLPDPKPQKATIDKWKGELDLAYRQQQVRVKRAQEYAAQGITVANLTIAMLEKVIENRPESIDALQLKRLAIKQANPIPTE